MKIIFLDIDGVLNCLPDKPREKWPDFHTHDERAYGLNPELVKNLKYVLDKTDAKIVVSSSWRHFDDYIPWEKNGDWREKLANIVGRKKDELFIGDTPSLHTQKMVDDGEGEYTLRGREIKKWVDDNMEMLKSEPNLRMCVIDDETIDIVSIIDRKFVVKTNRREGLTRKDADKAISILNRN